MTNQTTIFKHKSPKPSHREIHLPVEENLLLGKILELVNANQEALTLWRVVNTHAMKRLGMTDHGQIHFQIVSKTALKLLRLLAAKGIQPSIVTDFNLTPHHAEVVVVLASLFHDVGMSIHRKGHEEFSVQMSYVLLRELLSFLPVEERTLLVAETLHAIISHRKDGQPLTLEAGIVRVADALDMTKGRSRIPYQAGKIDIHSVSAMAVDDIEIRQGRHLPIERIDICDWVDNKGVRQIWLWTYAGTGKAGFTSNFSSKYGDFSNSNRELNDLPLCKHSYTVFDYNYGRSAAEALADHGFQFEAIFSQLNNEIFGQHFVGSNVNLLIPEWDNSIKSCGWFTWAPNAENGWDFGSQKKIETRCANWNAYLKDGQQPEPKTITCSIWGCTQLGYYQWWMQQIPGYQNQLTYRGKKMRNWWEFIVDFDAAMEKGKDLVEK